MKAQSLLKAVVLIFLVSLGSKYIPAQYVDKADSLRRIIPTLPDDREKADNLVSLGLVFFSKYQYDSAHHYFESAIALSKLLGYPQGQADALYHTSNVHYRRADLKATQDVLDLYLDLCDSISDTSRLARGYFQQARLFKSQSKYLLALHFSRLSLESYKKLDLKVGIYANYNVLGDIFSIISKYDSAASYYLRAIEICEKEGNERNLANLYNNLSGVFLQMEQAEQAMKYVELGFGINKKFPDDAGRMASSYMALGLVTAMQRKYDESFEYYNLAYEYYQKANDRASVLHVLNNLGDLSFKQRKNDIAIRYFDQALEGYYDLEDYRGIVTALGNKAAVMNNAGYHNEALLLFDSCLNISLREGNRELRKDVYWNITRSSRDIGDYQTAFEYYELYTELNDSIFEFNKELAINELEIIYEKERIMAQNQLLENENLKKDMQIKNRTILLGSFLLIMLLVVFIVLYLRQRAVKDRIIAQQQVRHLEEEKKLMAAKLLVEGQEEERKRIARELHDGLGVLLSATRMQFTTIRNVSPENRPLIEKAAQMLEQASGDVRKISHNMMPGLLTKLGLFEAVEDLFDNLNDNENLTASCHITGEPEERLAENKEIMIYRIIQELVNNTLKHANAGNISLDMNVAPDRLDINYRDDGRGFDAEKMLTSETGSFGLKSLESRVGFLNGKMDIQSAPGKGVRVHISVPI